MSDRIEEATTQTQAALARMGRAATPAVPSLGFAVRLLPPPELPGDTWPVLVVGDASELRARGVSCVPVHPNQAEALMDTADRFQALVVNALQLTGPWRGALSSASAWKADLVYDLCVAFRKAGLPTYLVRPETETTALFRWSSVAVTVAPWEHDGSEDTGSPQSTLWQALDDWGKHR